jgi:predicted PurR-regulated permease PerM
MTRKLVVFGMAVMTALLALALLWQFRMAVIYVLISLTIAAALRPLVQRLAGRRFMVRVAWILLYLAILGGFGFLLYLASKATIGEIQQFAQTVAVQDTWKLPVWLESSPFQLTVLAQLPAPSKLFEALTGSQGQL